MELEDLDMPDVMDITSGSLIAASKVNGTNVYNPAGDKLGSVEDIMLDKVSGRALYAIMSFGGFLGLGERYHPLPWSTLKYDTNRGGYLVNLDKTYLEEAPSYESGDSFEWTPEYGRRVDEYYKVPTAWR
jgi:hypothetical protein